MSEEWFVGYQEKLHRYEKLLKRQEELAPRQDEIKEYHEAMKVMEFLKTKAYLIDPRFISDLDRLKASIQEWKDVSDELEQLWSEGLNPGNLRHVVYSLAREAGLTLEELAKTLNLSTERVLVELCNQTVGHLRMDDFQKMCSYFGFSGRLWEHHYVIPPALLQLGSGGV